MGDVFVPEIEFNQNRQNTYFDATKVGTLDVLGATLEETFYYNPTNAVDRFLQMQFGEGRTGNILSPEQYKTSEYFREGLEAPEEGIKEGYAQLLAQNYDKRAAITQTLSRSKGGFGLGAAQFGTMLLGSVLDPINVASAFIPVFPAARYAHLVKNLGLTKARAVRGVVEGSVGATLVEPIVLGQAALEQDENYNLLDSFLNVTIGGVLGGGLHVGFGRISDVIERRSQKTKEQAILTSIKQSLTDQEVNPTPIIKADLNKSIEKNLEKQNNLSQEKPLEPVVQETEVTEKIVVYNTKGEPKVVEVVKRDEDGKVTVKDTDGTEKVLDSSNLVSRSIYDDNFEIDLTAEGEDLDLGFSATITNLIRGMNKEQAKKALEDAKFIIENELKDIRKGKKVRQGILRKEKTVINESLIARKEASLEAINLKLKELDGQTITKPKDPTIPTETTTVQGSQRTGKGLPSSLKAPKPKTLLQFIKENGKISSIDPLAGDVAQALGGNQNKQGKFILDVKNTKGAIAKKGIGIDEMTTRVQEAGYFLDKSDMDYGIDAATPDDLIALIRREQDGEILYSRSQELEYDNYVAAGEKQELVDALDIDPTNMTDAELDIAIDLARNKEQLSQDILLSEKMEQPSVLTAQEFENAKIEALENNYNMGNGKQEYGQSVLERAGIDDTFNLQTRETEIDAEIEALEFDIENTSNAENIDKDDLVEFDENIKVADDLIARSDESFDTATNAAASCIMRNTK